MGFFSSLFGGGKKAGPGVKRKKAKVPIADIDKRFDLRARTGQGSMSKCWHAYDKNLGRMVCLKLLDKAKTAKFEERFTNQGLDKPSEGEICMALKHPNCVATYEHGKSTKGEPYLVMEWIEGLGLNYLIETKAAQLKGNRVNFLKQLCDAVDYLHSIKFLHRDLCPRNVMVTKEGVVKLIDFGLTIPYTPDYCRPGNRTGTADYLAPEIIKRQTTDHRVDIFALGVTAFEIFTGQLPWERSLSSEETLRRHLNTPSREPKDLNPDLDDDLCAVLKRAIARDPTGRFPTASVFKEALDGLGRDDY
ncbi:MAG TPA: serine/threonine-protein kinase [Gemmataceae bacterium]|nr:serine/threonine-protein kinase [Gemmataceae bacterium]